MRLQQLPSPAQRADIFRLVLKDTLVIALLGIGVGLPISVAAARLVTTQLFAISPSDPVTLVGAVSVMIAVAVLAGYLPARRAARLDPVRALRYE